MEETRPTVQAAYLSKAQTMGRDYYQKVKIGGKNYFVMVLQGGDLSRMQAHDTEKLKNLSEAFFSAHQDASGTDLNDSDITHIDSEGIHFRGRETQFSDETEINEETEDLLMAEFVSKKDAIVEHHTQAKPDPVAKEAVPAQYRPYLNEEDEDEDGLYDEGAVDSAIESYAFSRLNRIKDLVISANPANREEIDRRFGEIEESDNCTLEEALDEACAMLKQHMTAQTVWKAMMNVLLPEQLIFVRDPEEEEEFFDCEEEDPPVETNPFGHLNSDLLGSREVDPLRPREELSTELRDREQELDPFASVTPTPTKEGWGAMFSRWGSTAYSYVPSFRGSGSTTNSRVEEEFELEPVRRPPIVELDSGYSSGEEEYSDYSSDEEEDFFHPLGTPELHSVHGHEEIHVAPLTAREVYNELTLAAQGAPEGNFLVASKQAVARTAHDKIRAKIRKEKDIQAFTEDERQIIKEAMTRNARFMDGRDYNSKLTTILGGLDTIAEGH